MGERRTALGEAIGLVVFDVDGTLIDSAALIVGAMQDACDQCGVPFVGDAALLHTVGLPLRESVPVLFSALTAEQHEALIAVYSSEYRRRRQAADSPERLFEGVAEGLQRLWSAGLTLAVATGKSMRGLQAALAKHQIGGFFATLQTGDHGPGKPHPDMLERAIAETESRPTTTLMVGDTTFDMEMGSRAHVRTVGVSWGHHTVAALQQSGAEFLVQSFGELVALLLLPSL